jgi:hypothetical protein
MELKTCDVIALRPHLLGRAYRMLADYDEAEDVVQEAYLCWERAESGNSDSFQMVHHRIPATEHPARIEQRHSQRAGTIFVNSLGRPPGRRPRSAPADA